MNFYQILGVISIALLALAVGLSIHVLTGTHSKKTVYAISGTVLILMMAVTITCAVIYREYGR